MELPITLQDHHFSGSIIVDGQGADIARVDRAADAAYIVNAVNSHARLVGVCEKIRDAMCVYDECAHLFSELEQAIAAAKEASND